MKKLHILVVLLIGVMLFLPANASLALKVKIGLIDTQKIMRESKAAKRARTEFLKDREAKRAILNDKQQKALKMEEELKKEGRKMAPDVRKEKTEKLAQEVKELRRLKTDLEEELKKKDAELTRRILTEVREVVEAYRNKRKITVIFEKRSVVAFDGAIDITDEIIKLYDTVK